MKRQHYNHNLICTNAQNRPKIWGNSISVPFTPYFRRLFRHSRSTPLSFVYSWSMRVRMIADFLSEVVILSSLCACAKKNSQQLQHVISKYTLNTALRLGQKQRTLIGWHASLLFYRHRSARHGRFVRPRICVNTCTVTACTTNNKLFSDAHNDATFLDLDSSSSGLNSKIRRSITNLICGGCYASNYTLHRVQKNKVSHTPNDHRRCAHIPVVGRWARRWINHYCLWRMANAMPDLWFFFSQFTLVLITPTHGGMARLSWPWWPVTCRDFCPHQH